MGRPLKKDWTGERTGKLTVLARAPSQPGQAMWFARCDCGTICIVRGGGLNSGRCKSCGCLKGETNRRLRLRHGKAAEVDGRKARVYRIWASMKNRCHNENTTNFERYGARGIYVCERWFNSFDAFLADMGEPPTEQHSLDRKNNDGPYSPDNCRWATAIEQRRNRRRKK